MQRRRFLAGVGAALFANIRLLRAIPQTKSSSSSSVTRLDEAAVGRSVNLFPYGRIQSWLNPDASAMLQTRLGSRSQSLPLQLSELVGKGSEIDIGVEWPEFRTIQSAVIRFSGQRASADKRTLEVWDGLTGLQGSWKPIQPGPGDEFDGQTWTATFPPLRTCKVRLRIPDDRRVTLESFQVQGPSRWKAGEIHIEMGHQKEQKSYDGHLEVYNGEVLNVRPLGGTVVGQGESWQVSASSGSIAGIAVKLLYTSGLDVDRTIMTLRTRAGDFSFLPIEALEEQAIYVPDFGAFIHKADSNLTLDEYKHQHSREFRIIDAVAKLPEQTLEQAYDHIAADRVVAFVGLDSNSQKFGIAPTGHVIVGYGDPSFGGIIKPQFNVYFDSVEFSSIFAPPGPPPESLFEQPVEKRQRLAEGWLPVVISEWGSASDVTYERTDFAALPGRLGSIDQSKLGADELSVMISRLTIRNTSPTTKTVHFYVKPWKPVNGNPSYGNLPVAVKNAWQTVLANNCTMVAEGDSEFGVCYVDTAGKGSLEAEPSIGGIRYSLELNGGQEHEIQMVIPGRPVAQNEIHLLQGLPYQQLYEATTQYWKAQLTQGMQIDIPHDHVQNLYNANLQHFLITFTKDLRRGEYYANTAAFYYGPIGSESSPVIQALDMRGMHQHAEKCLQAFLSTQGDAVPDGEYKSPKGGFYHYWPWYTINQGCVLWTLAEHYLYSGDKEWLRKIAPQIIAGCEFIVEGRNFTKNEHPGGRRPVSYGFAPAGTIGDPRSWKYSFMVSGFFYLGLKKCAQVLRDLEPATAARFEAEAADFLETIRSGLKAAIARSPVVRLRDGSSIPCVPPFVSSHGFTSDAKDNIDPDPRFSYASDCTAGALQLVKCEVLTPDASETDWLMNALEDRFFMFSPHQSSRVKMQNISMDWFNLGGFDKMQPYAGPAYAELYLQRDQVPNFLRAFFNTLAAIADKQNLSFQEELGGTGGQPQKTHEEAHFLQQLRIMLIMENGQDLCLTRGTPRAWLEDGKRIAVSRAPTYFGETSFQIQSFTNQGRIEATVQAPSRIRPAHLHLRLRHPKEAPLKRVVLDGQSWSDFDPSREWISLPVDRGQVNVQAYY
jgi:hypothetical protein